MPAPLASMSVHICAIGVLAVSLLGPEASLAQCVDYEDYAHWVGDVRLPDGAAAVAVSGGYAYVADDDSGLVVVDLSDPGHPTIVASSPIPGKALKVVVSGDLAYVVGSGDYLTETGSFNVVDISTPTSPVVVGSFYYAPWLLDVAVAGQYAYTVGGLDVLFVVDVSQAAQPVIVGTVDLAANCESVAAAGGYVYVATWSEDDRFQVFDVSVPAQPVPLGQVALPDGIPKSIAISGDHAFVVGSSGMQVIDVTAPLLPLIVHQIPGSPRSVQISGSRAYVTEQFGNGVVSAYDISTPSAPVPVSSWRASFLTADVAAFGDYACAVSYDVQMIDMSGPTTPAGSIVHTTQPDSVFANIAASDDRVYVLNTYWERIPPYNERFWYELQVLDTSVPGSIVHLGSTQLLEGGVVAVAGDGVAAYIGTTKGLVAVDLTAPPPYPVSLPFGQNGLLMMDIELSGSHAFMTVNGDLRILDNQVPGSPVLLAVAPTPGYARHIALSGPYAYVTERSAGSSALQIVDVSTPTSPQLIGGVSLSEARDVAVSGNHAYVASTQDGLVVVDVSDPAAPFVVTSTLPIDASGVQVAGNYAYVSPTSGFPDRYDVYILDISDPANPRTMGAIRESAFRMAVEGGFLYGITPTRVTQAPLQCPLTGVTAPLAAIPAAGLHVSAWPLPLRGGALRVSFGGIAKSGEHATVTMHDVRGRKVATLARGSFAPGTHQLIWNGRDRSGRVLGSGVYFLRLETPRGAAGRKVPVIR